MVAASPAPADGEDAVPPGTRPGLAALMIPAYRKGQSALVSKV
jgi:hypothetical protein